MILAAKECMRRCASCSEVRLNKLGLQLALQECRSQTTPRRMERGWKLRLSRRSQMRTASGYRATRLRRILLGRIRELTGGASLDMNIRLVKNNAAVGTAIAVALSRLGKATA